LNRSAQEDPPNRSEEASAGQSAFSKSLSAMLSSAFIEGFPTADPPFICLLVPLDGSGLAEAAYMAERFGAKGTVTHIIERDAPQAVHGDRHLNDAHEAEAHLREVGRRI
jgi:hypothetical protein